MQPATALLILAVAWVANRLVRRAIRRLVASMSEDRGLAALRAPTALARTGEIPSLRRVQRAETVGALLKSMASFGIWTLAGLMALGTLGLNLGPLIAGAGIVGVAVGFGAQNLVRDFLSGIFMLMEDQYGVGDVIDAGPATGTVESVGLRTTRLRDVNGTVWHLPNGQIERIGNRSQQWSRAVLDVDVSYQTDIAHATDVIKRTAQTMCEDATYSESILAEPEVWGVENLGLDSVTIRLVLKTAPHDQLKVIRELRARIKAAFDETGIEIPFAQRTVWHRNGDGAVAVLPRTAEE